MIVVLDMTVLSMTAPKRELGVQTPFSKRGIVSPSAKCDATESSDFPDAIINNSD